MKTRRVAESVWIILEAMIEVLRAMFSKVCEGYVRGHVKVETRESKARGPWRVREEQREANM